jgi:hypothetical protein
MQPRRQRLASADTPRSLNQCQEHGLERIFGIGMMGKQLSADRPHKRTMPTHEFLKRGLIPRLNEPRQQVGVGSAGVRNANDRMKQRLSHH